LRYLFAENESLVPAEGPAILPVCSRSGDGATRFNKFGDLEVVPANTPRFNYDPMTPYAENLITRSEEIGNGSYWPVGGTGGNIVIDMSVRRPNGNFGARLLTPVSGTATSFYVSRPHTLLPNTQYTHQIKFKPKPGVNQNFRLLAHSNFYGTNASIIWDRTNGTVSVTGNTGVLSSYGVIPLEDGWYLMWFTATTAMTIVSSSFAIIAWPTGGTETAGMGYYVDEGGINLGPLLRYRRTEAVPAQREYKPLGWRIEEPRTNGIRNNSMQGAAVGTIGAGGSWPQYWSFANGGLNADILSIGKERGMDCMFVRLYGQATGGSAGIRFEGTNVIGAAVGQTWTGTIPFRIVSVATAASTFMGVNLTSYLAGGGGAADQPATANGSGYAAAALTAKDLLDNIAKQSFTLTDASVAFVRSQLFFGLTSGNNYDFVICIGMPTMEQGSWASSVIRTTNAAVTRGAETNLLNGLLPVMDTSKMAVYAEVDYFHDNVVGGNRAILSVENASQKARTLIMLSQSAVNVRFQSWTRNGSSYSSTVNTALLPNTMYKVMSVLSDENISLSVSGGGIAAPSGSPVTVPEATAIRLGQTTIGGTSAQNFLNGHIKELRIYNRIPANAELMALTA
jgi:hypothetical protein